VTVYLKNKGGWAWLIVGIPAIFMSIMTLWAAILNQVNFSTGSFLLQTINVLVIVIVGWIVIEAVIKFSAKEKSTISEFSK